MALSSKLTKVSESFTVNMYDNGYMIEVNGVDSNDDWDRCKIVCSSLEEVVELIKEINNMPKDR
jgi:hypothetical protein